MAGPSASHGAISYLSGCLFVRDPSSVDLNSGRHVNWKGAARNTRGNDVKNYRTYLLAAVATCCALFGSPATADSPVSLVINKRIVPAGSDLLVTIKLERNSDNRTLTIEADSDDYLRSSTMQLDGEFEAATHQYWFRQLPEGEYSIVARVSGTRGVRGVATVPVSVFGTVRRK